MSEPTTVIEHSWDLTQQSAIERCTDVQQRVAAVTGEAGTGKTTIMKVVHRVLTEAGYSVALCAPTGKASKRIAEATGIEASTIHRLLEFTFPGERDEKTGKVYGTSIPKRTGQNPLGYDFILADEYAMVSQSLHRDLLNAIKPGGCVRVFGDTNQLPPIEEDKRDQLKPSPFSELLERFDGVRLTQIHRQGEGSSIVTNGRRILGGMVPVKTEEYGITYTDQPVKWLQEYVLKSEDAGIKYGTSNHQIITPRNKKCWIGATELNMSIQPLYHETMAGAMTIPRHKWEDKHPLRLLVGDKVIYVKNDYNLEVYNGETGIVTDLTDMGEVVIDFGDRVISFPPIIIYHDAYGDEKSYDPRKDIQLAYVVTTHKAQGSEYEHVCYLMGNSAWILLCRSNFYTGTTRARKHVDVATDQRAMATSLQRKVTKI